MESFQIIQAKKRINLPCRPKKYYLVRIEKKDIIVIVLFCKYRN